MLDGPPNDPLRAVLRDLTWLILATASLWLFHLFGRTWPTEALAAVWAVVAGFIAGGLFWRARIRRRAFLRAYVASGSPLERWLRGGWLLAARQAAVAALLSALLVVAILRTTPLVWMALLAGLPVLAVTQVAVRRALVPHVHAAYLPELSWRIALVLVGAGLLVAVTVIALHQAYPDFSGVTLERAVWHLVDRERARSEPVLALLQMAAAKDGARLWLAQQLMPAPGASLVEMVGWLVVVAEQALFVWSYLLMCNGILIGANRRDRAGA